MPPVDLSQLESMIDTPEKARKVKAVLDAFDPGAMGPEDQAAYKLTQRAVRRWVNPDPTAAGRPGAGVYNTPRGPNDTITATKERRLAPPPTAKGDPAGNNTATLVEHGKAALRGLGDLVGMPGSMEEVKQGFDIRNPKSALKLAFPPAAPAIDMAEGQIESFRKGRKEDSALDTAAAFVPMAPAAVETTRNIAAPVKTIAQGKPVPRDQALAATRSGTAAVATLASAHPAVGRKVSTRAKKSAAAHETKRTKLYEQDIPDEINRRLTPYVDDIDIRLKRGDNPGATIYDASKQGKDLLDVNVAKAEKAAQHEATQQRLADTDMQFTVPENLFIDAVAGTTMEKMVAAVGDNPTSNPALRQIIDRTRQTGTLSPGDYQTLRDMATGNYEIGINKKTGEPIMGVVAMPPALRETIGYIERVRAEHGGRLELTPAEINQIKATRYRDIPDKEFLKQADDASKGMAAIRRDQATGLRALLDKVTTGPDGVSPISEMNRRYADLSAATDAAEGLKVAPRLEAPLANTVMASSTGIGSLGAVGGMGVFTLLGMDPGIGAALGGMTGIPIGAVAARSIRDVALSPRTGVKMAGVKERIARARGYQPPVKTTPRGPSGPPAGGSVGAPPTPPTTTPPSTPKPTKTVSGPLQYTKPKPEPGPIERHASDIKRRDAIIESAAEEAVNNRNANVVLREVSEQRAAKTPSAPPPSRFGNQDISTEPSVVTAQSVEKKQKPAAPPVSANPLEQPVKGDWRQVKRDVRPKVEPKVTPVDPAAMTTEQLNQKVAEWTEGLGNAKRLNDTKRVKWYEGKIAAAKSELAKGEDRAVAAPVSTEKPHTAAPQQPVADPLAQFDDFDNMDVDALIDARTAAQAELDAAKTPADKKKLSALTTAIQRGLEKKDGAGAVTGNKAGATLATLGDITKPRQQTLRPAKSATSDPRREPKPTYQSKGLQKFDEHSGVRKGGFVRDRDGRKLEVTDIVAYSNGTVYVSTPNGQVPIDKVRPVK